MDDTIQERGILAIIALQGLAAVEETREQATRGWHGMRRHEKEQTLLAYNALFPSKAEPVPELPPDPPRSQPPRPDPTKFHLCSGTVQPYVYRDTPWFMHHFGRAEYCRDKPVISDSIREKAQPIIDEMNAGTLDLEEGVRRLDEIYW